MATSDVHTLQTSNTYLIGVAAGNMYIAVYKDAGHRISAQKSVLCIMNPITSATVTQYMLCCARISTELSYTNLSNVFDVLNGFYIQSGTTSSA